MIIFFFVREPARGASEPEIAAAERTVKVRFSWKAAFGLLKKRSLVLLFLNGFFGVFPWQVITFWFFRYLETERAYASGRMFVFMVIVVLLLAAGYPLGGALGDAVVPAHPARQADRGRLRRRAGRGLPRRGHHAAPDPAASPSRCSSAWRRSSCRSPPRT